MAETSIEEAREESVQSRARGGTGRLAGSSFVFLLAQTNEQLPPWWSTARDWELRNFWKRNDYLGGAINTLETMLTTIPVQVIPRDINVASHVRQAKEVTRMLNDESDLGAGWTTFYSKFVEDLITQDNGSFAEIIAEGDPSGPIIGMPVGIAHLDAWRCRRTGDPEFPVVYHGEDGIFKFHFTRIIYFSSQPSPIEQMYEVGFCAISRCVGNAQSLLDMLVFKQEKLGSRPQRQILVTTGGLDPEDVASAFEQANEGMDNQRLSRYSRTVVVGASGLDNAAIDKIDLTSAPDGFTEEEGVSLGMAAVALAFAMDPRELWPGQVSRSTRAEALISHIKQRGKGPGQILQMTERQFNFKFLPAHLEMKFDFQDDAQDAQQAEIQNTRSVYHTRDLEIGILDERTVREQMLEDGDLNEAQFVRLELDDGRTPDGRDLLVLFFDKDHAEMLDLGVENPLDTRANDTATMQTAIIEKRAEMLAEIAGAPPNRRMEFERAIGALDRLALLYGGISGVVGAIEEEEDDMDITETEEEPEPTGNANLDGDDLEVKVLTGSALAIQDAANAVERVNKRAFKLMEIEERDNGR